MALAEIDRAIAAGVRFGCVLADAGYGLSAPFRHGLTARKLAWAVGIPRHLCTMAPRSVLTAKMLDYNEGAANFAFVEPERKYGPAPFDRHSACTICSTRDELEAA